MTEAPASAVAPPDPVPPPAAPVEEPVASWSAPAPEAPRREPEPSSPAPTPAPVAVEAREEERPSAPAPTEWREPAPVEAAATASAGSEDMASDELATMSRKLTEDLLRAMGFEPKVKVRAEGNRVDVTVEVERDGDLLNGRQGETRQAIQHLLNRFLNRGDGSRYHLQLEVNDYWQQREVELADLAKRMADDAVARRAEVVTGYLNSQERRIVHVTLREDSRVRTFSLGSGMLKRVAVAPADFPERTEDESAS